MRVTNLSKATLLTKSEYFFVYGDVMIIVVPEAKPLTATLLIFKHSTDSGGIWYFREKEKNNNK